MATLQSDCSVGIKKESSYGVAVTVDRFPEFTDQTLVQKTDFIQGEGLRVGKVAPRQARRSAGKVTVEGDVKLDYCTKGLGVFLEAMMGTATSTVRSGSIYQQVATPLVGLPPTYTIQVGLPPTTSGAAQPQTFLGCAVDKWELSAKAGEVLELSTSWVGKSLDTGVGYAAPSYVAAPHEITFQHGTIKIATVASNPLVVPTTTALGTSTATAAANVTKFSLKGDNALDKGGYVFGSAGARGRRPVYGMRKWEGSFTAEFDDIVYRDWYLNQTPLMMIVEFVSTESITGGAFATLQIAIPCLMLEGDVPTSNKGDVIEVNCDFTVLDGEVAASPIYLTAVTADTAL